MSVARVDGQAYNAYYYGRLITSSLHAKTAPILII